MSFGARIASPAETRPLVVLCLAAVVAVLSPAGLVRASVVTDSSINWSSTGTQGAGGWHGGYYNLSQDANGTYARTDFLAFPVAAWDGFKWDLTPASIGPWTELGREATHPNGTNSTPGHEHWTIRRWVSDRALPNAALIWHVRKDNLSGTGVTGYLFVNGAQVDTATIAGNDGVGVTRTVRRSVAVGDAIDLALGPLGVGGDRTDGADGAVSRLTIDDGIADEDRDGVLDGADNCPSIANANQADGDGDLIGTACDNCPVAANADQRDRDRDGIGDACDEPATPASFDVRVNEIHYYPRVGPALEFVELHNNATTAVNVGGWAFIRGIRHEFAAGTTIPGKGFLVVCRSPEAMSQYFGRPISSFIPWVDSGLDAGGERLTLVDGNGALVDEVEYDNQAPWDPDANGLGPSLERLCFAADSSAPTNWVADPAREPTPLAANSASLCPPPVLPPPRVALNEIHYHPENDRDAELEFVELTNTTTQAIDLDGHCFTRGIDYCFAQRTILAPGGFLVVARNAAALRAAYSITNVVGDFGLQLANDRDRITLLDPAGALVDSVRYGDSGDWPIAADGAGFSLEKILPEAVSDDPASWTDSGSLSPPAAGEWETVTITGNVTSDTLYFYVGDEGEFLIDDVSVVNVAIPGTNHVGNGAFTSGIAGWSGNGNHALSRWSRSAGGTIFPEAALHVIATDPGTGASNSVSAPMTTALDRTPGLTYRLRFSYRHIAGSTGLVARFSGATPSTGIYWNLGSAASGAVTPGQENLARRSALPPFISNVGRVPREPGGGEPVTITARVRGSLTGVKVIADLPGGARDFVMLDDGLSGDGLASDGVYAADLPGQPHGTAVTFRIEASSAAGSRLSPSVTDTMSRHGYYVNDNQPDSKLPVWTLILPTTDPRGFASSLDCENYRPCSFAAGGDLYYQIGIRGRGASVCYTTKRFLKLKFPRGHEFLDRRKLNLQSLWTDKSLVREHLSWELFGQLGNPYCTHDYIRLHANGSYFGLYAAFEHPDERFLARNGLYSEGNLYKATASREEVSGVYEEETNQDGDMSDLTAFLTALHAAPAAGLVNFFKANVNEDTMIDYQAAHVLINNADYPHKNHFLYHDTESGKWMPTAWDLDLTFGKLWDGTYGGVLNDKMFTPGITPWYTTNVRGEGVGNHLLDKFFAQAGTYYRRAYMARLWSAIQEKYTPDLFEDKIGVLSDLIYEEQLDDFAYWGRSSPTANDPTAPAGFEPNLDRVRQHILTRRNYLLNYLRTTENFNGVSRLKITEVMYNPVAGGDAEFLELWNNSGAQLAIAGWSITGLDEVNEAGTRLEFKFPADSIVQPGEVIIVAKDPARFASLYGAVGQVFGPYPGNLDNAGELLRLKDTGPGHPATIDHLRYDNQDPWPIRADGFGYSLELMDVHTNLDNDLAANWRSSLALGGSPGVVHLLDTTIRFRRGNCNTDQSVDLSDALTILLYLFAGRARPGCIDGCDVNGNGTVAIEDAVALLNYLFAEAGFAIPAPTPSQCQPARAGFCEQSNCS